MIRVAETKYGKVKGLPAADPRITAFKGIPFAAPPVGENRWRAPQPLQPWEGVREAYEFAPISVQDTPGLGTDLYCREWHVDPQIAMSEDCLYLNVWTNAKSTDEKLPVLVWIFGGGFQWGYTAEMEFDGERIARRGIVVVSVNYRLGALGFLTHPQLTKEQPDAPANFGLLDQQAGLRWVKENIAAFGGDPDNITLAGQSAGGGSVLNQITSDTNKGYINRAIIMSGMFHNLYHANPFLSSITLEEAEQKGIDFFDFLGVKTLEEARALDALHIRNKYGEFREAHPFFTPVIDHCMIQGSPIDRLAKGEYLQIPIMAGHTMDEFKDYLGSEKETVDVFGEYTEKLLSFEETKTFDGVGYGSVNTVELGIKAAFLSKQRYDKSPCYFYQFDVDIPGEDNPGTFHSVDLWFFFETLAKCTRPYVGRHYDIARQMCEYWCNFIRSGNPNGVDMDGTALTQWNTFTQESRDGVRFTKDGVKQVKDDSEFVQFLEEYIIKEKFSK